ncbi:hypothetical protein GW17_00058483, partial [Ensete ventricosum]
ALTPLAPSPSSPPLCRRLLPLPADSHPAKGRPPLRSEPPPLLAAGEQPLVGTLQPAPFTSATLQAGVPVGGYRPCGLAATNLAHGEPDSKHDERKVGYSCEQRKHNLVHQLGKGATRRDFQRWKPALMFLKQVWRNSIKAKEGSLG